jgi:hypothetical protein
LEQDLGSDDGEDDAAREALHVAMARRNSLTTVFTGMWEKTKRARNIVYEEEWNVRKDKRASIRSEMTRCGFFIVDYSDNESDLSN